jgi:hypothetical protein
MSRTPYLSASHSRETTPSSCHRSSCHPHAAFIGLNQRGILFAMQTRPPGREVPQPHCLQPLAAVLRPRRAGLLLCSPASFHRLRLVLVPHRLPPHPLANSSSSFRLGGPRLLDMQRRLSLESRCLRVFRLQVRGLRFGTPPMPSCLSASRFATSLDIWNEVWAL